MNAENDDDYFIYIKTVQSIAFKILVEALKEILDINLEFDKNGIKIQSLDSSRTVLVYLTLEAENFENIIVKQKIIGVNTQFI